MRDTIGGYPYQIKKESGKIVLQFFPKSETAQNPNLVRFQLILDNSDLKKIAKLNL